MAGSVAGRWVGQGWAQECAGLPSPPRAPTRGSADLWLPARGGGSADCQPFSSDSGEDWATLRSRLLEAGWAKREADWEWRRPGGRGRMRGDALPPPPSWHLLLNRRLPVSPLCSDSHYLCLCLSQSLPCCLSQYLSLSFFSVFLGLYACPLASFYLSLCVSHDFWLSLLCISVSLPHPRHYLSNFVLWWKPASPISVEIRGPGPSGASRQRLLTCPDSVYKSERSWGHFSYPILPVLQACPLPVWPGMMYTARWHLILIHKSWVEIYLRNPSWWHQTRIMVFKESWGVFAPSSASGHLRLYCGHLDGSEPRNNVCSAQEVPATIGWIPLGRAGKLPHPPT